MDNPSLKSIFQRITKNVKNEKDEEDITCACYLHRFIVLNDQNAYEKFKKIFVKLDNKRKNKVINYYLAYKEKIKNENKQKMKK